MWFTRLAIARPLLIWMALAAIATLGFRAYSRLPAELNPQVDIPTLVITTIYPGANPPEIESQITKPLEDALSTVPGVREVTSSSQASVSIISVECRVGSNLDIAVADARGHIDAVRGTLPAESRLPVIAKLDINARPILEVGFTSKTLSLQALRAIVADAIQPRVQRVGGVANAQVVGGVQREIQALADTARLQQYGLTVTDIVNSLKAAGRDVPGGSVTQGGLETTVRLAGAFTSLDAIRDAQILAPQLQQQAAQTSMQTPPVGDALPVPSLTVGEVATVRDGQATRTEINRINGLEGVTLVVSRASDSNTVQVVTDINKALVEMRPTLPADLQITTLHDDAQTVRAALDDVDASLILGAVLAMVVILLFLHNLRGTLIVSLAIPACIVATFLVLNIAGFTLNQITLLALSLSVGILVDDSIVVLESITRHLQNGEEPRDAALNGRAEIGFADLTTTLVDVVVFVPIAFMGGIVGGFFREFGLTIASATLLSLLVSFSVTPMLAARWYRKGERLEATRGLYFALEKLYRGLEGLYRRIMTRALRHRWPVLIAGVVTLVVTLVLSLPRLGTEFMPGADQGLIAINIEMPPGSSLDATDATAKKVEDVISKLQEVQSSETSVGQVVGGFGSIPQQGAQFAQVNLFLHHKPGLLDSFLHPGSGTTRKRSDQAVARDVEKQIAGIARQSRARITTSAVRSVTGLSSQVQFQLRGADMNALTQFADQVRERIKTIPGVLDPDSTVRSGNPELRAAIDPRRAAAFNLPLNQVSATVRDSLAGNADNIFRQAGQEFPIRVVLDPIQRKRPADIANIPVGSDAQGQPVLLADVADIKQASGPTNIDRYNGQHVITISAALAPNLALGNVEQEVLKIVQAMPHEGIAIAEGGDSKTLAENIPYFVSALLLAIALVYIVMAALFNSLTTPFVIMFTLPMALIGAFASLALTGESLSLVSGIGILMLMGLMGRNAILLLDFTNTLRSRGMTRTDALLMAGATRLRPILMTTTATIVGMLPVALRIGEAAEVRAPMAIVVIGGLIVSTVLTLVMIPVLYSLFDDWFGNRKANRK